MIVPAMNNDNREQEFWDDVFTHFLVNGNDVDVSAKEADKALTFRRKAAKLE